MMQMRKATRQYEWKVYCPWIRVNLKASFHLITFHHQSITYHYDDTNSMFIFHHRFKLKYVNFITLTNNLFSFWKISLSILLLYFQFFSHHSLNVFHLRKWYGEKFNFSHNWRNSVLRLKLWNFETQNPKNWYFHFPNIIFVTSHNAKSIIILT